MTMTSWFLCPLLFWALSFYFVGCKQLYITTLILWRTFASHSEWFTPNLYNVKNPEYEDFSLFWWCSFISTPTDRFLMRPIRLGSAQTHILRPVSLHEFFSVRFLSSAEAKVTFKRLHLKINILSYSIKFVNANSDGLNTVIVFFSEVSLHLRKMTDLPERSGLISCGDLFTKISSL